MKNPDICIDITSRTVVYARRRLTWIIRAGEMSRRKMIRSQSIGHHFTTHIVVFSFVFIHLIRISSSILNEHFKHSNTHTHKEYLFFLPLQEMRERQRENKTNYQSPMQVCIDVCICTFVCVRSPIYRFQMKINNKLTARKVKNREHMQANLTNSRIGKRATTVIITTFFFVRLVVEKQLFISEDCANRIKYK